MAFLTISLCSQLSAIGGNGFGLFEPFSRLSDLPPIATGCVRSAPYVVVCIGDIAAKSSLRVESSPTRSESSRS